MLSTPDVNQAKHESSAQAMPLAAAIKTNQKLSTVLTSQETNSLLIFNPKEEAILDAQPNLKFSFN